MEIIKALIIAFGFMACGFCIAMSFKYNSIEYDFAKANQYCYPYVADLSGRMYDKKSNEKNIAYICSNDAGIQYDKP